MRQSRGKRELKVPGEERKKRIRRRVIIGLAVVAVLAFGSWAALSAWISPPVMNHSSSSQGNTGVMGDVDMDSWEIETPQASQSGQREGVYTFLVAGQDTVGGGNTDTMILITYDTNHKTVHGMNLPRDTMINVSTSSKRLNAVYNYNKGRDQDTQVENGMAALKKEVSKLTGIIPNFYVLIQWEAVGELVDALGGVYFDVPFDMNYDDPYQDLHIHQTAGYRKLSGEDAMQVVRWRQNNTGASGGDVARISIQQDFLKAAAKQCLQPATLLKAPALAQVFLNNVTTDLKLGNLLYFAQQASGMDPDSGVVLNTMPWTDARYPGVSMILPVLNELLELINDGLNPYVEAIKASDLQLLYRNANGSYSVTSGVLADSSLASATTGSGSSVTPAEPSRPVEPVTPADAPTQPNTPSQPGGEIPTQADEPQPQEPDNSEQPGEATNPSEPGGSETVPENPGSPSEGGDAPSEEPGGTEGVPDWMIPVTE